MDDNLWSQLPLELKIEILEQTVQLYPETTARFALISRAYQRIFEPRLYSTIRITADRQLRLPTSKRFVLDTKPASFLTQHVQHIHFDNFVSKETMVACIRTCAHVQTISFAVLNRSYAEMILPLVQPLPFLTRLGVNTGVGLLDLHDLVFPTITHLFTRFASYNDLASFPNLTHLALRDVFQSPPDTRDILGRMPMLRALVLLVPDMPSLHAQALHELAATDARVTLNSNWRGAVRDFEQIWWKADCT